MRKLLGTKLSISKTLPNIAAEDVPRCSKMDGSTLTIIPNDVDAGWFGEANSITVTDGERTAVYVAFRKVDADELAEIHKLNAESSPQGE